MRKIVVLAALALTSGMAAALDAADLDGLWQADVDSSETGYFALPDAPKADRIVGGDAAGKGEFPFLVSLQDSGGHFCGGSLIRKDWVLTAGHCVKYGVVSVVIGLHDLRETAGTENFKVDSIVPHPLRSAKDYDFALVRLAGESKFQPISLNREELSGEAELIVAGWGRTAEAGAVREKLLRKMTVPLVSWQRCSASYPGKITDRMICAGYDSGARDACRGDSGGPLFMGSGAEKTLVGVVSWGKGCARPYMYGVYAKVSSVIPWIESVVDR